MTDHANTYPDLVNVEDWLNAKGYTGEAGACHQAMSLIRKQEVRIAELRKEADMMHSEYKTAVARIAELTAALKPFADIETLFCDSDEMEFPLWTFVRADLTVDKPMIKIADLRAARAALENKND